MCAALADTGTQQPHPNANETSQYQGMGSLSDHPKTPGCRVSLAVNPEDIQLYFDDEKAKFSRHILLETATLIAMYGLILRAEEILAL